MTTPTSQASGDTVSLLGALSIGIGGMVGGGIFAVLGLAAMLGGGATPLAFGLAGLVALLTAYAYARLSVAYPSRGGTTIFIDKAFGAGLLSGSANILLWISYIVTLALYAVACGNYAATFFDTGSGDLLRHLLISAAIVFPTLLNLLGARIISQAETFVVGFKLAILILVIVAGLRGVNPSSLAPANWPGLAAIIAAGMIIFVAYEGFELIANAAEDVIDYKKTLPRAFFGSVLFVMLLYVLISVVTVGTLTPEQIVQSADFALAEAAKPSLGQIGFTLVAVAAVLATLSAINATLYGAARLTYTIAAEGELPEIMERKVWSRPAVGLLITAVAALLLANLVNLDSISLMGSAGFLLIFAIVNAANVVLAAETGSSRALSGLGVAACLGALLVLAGYSARQNPAKLLALLAMIGLALLIEFAYRRLRRDNA